MYNVYMALFDQLSYVLLTLLVPLGRKICSSQEYIQTNQVISNTDVDSLCPPMFVSSK